MRVHGDFDHRYKARVRELREALEKAEAEATAAGAIVSDLKPEKTRPHDAQATK